MDVPPPLAPWKDALSVVSPEVATSLGSWLTRLAAMVGPLRTRTLVGTGEPDGYDGLTRRGPWERLLLSEWLLASEVPEEFLRRAAMRELGFHRMAYREPADARASVALFDAGPSQLGVPRLAHVAALLVLAQRAADAKARFGWGILQQPPDNPAGPGGLMLGVTAQNVDAIVRARQPTPPGDRDLDAWAALEARGEGWSDVWIIGPRETWDRWRALSKRRAATTGGCLAVRDTYEADALRVRVDVVQRSTVSEVTLTPPEEKTCVRLLRSVAATGATATTKGRRAPFPRGRRYTLAHTPVTNLVFSPTGAGVAWRTKSGALMIAAVPKWSGGNHEKLRTLIPRPGETFLAVGWIKRRVVVASEHQGGLHVYEWNGPAFPRAQSLRPWLWEGREAFVTRAAGTLEALHVYQTNLPGLSFAAAMETPDGNLFRLDAGGATVIRDPPRGAVFVDQGRLMVAGRPCADVDTLISLPQIDGVVWTDPAAASVVIVHDPDEVDSWFDSTPAVKVVIAVSAAPPFTVVRHPRSGAPVTVYTAPRDVVSTAFEPRKGLVALVTDDGGITVVDAVGDRGLLLQLIPEAS